MPSVHHVLYDYILHLCLSHSYNILSVQIIL